MLRNIRKGLRKSAEYKNEFDSCFGTALTGIQGEFGSFSCYTFNSMDFLNLEKGISQLAEYFF
jgi:hypothetical protein